MQNSLGLNSKEGNKESLSVIAMYALCRAKFTHCTLAVQFISSLFIPLWKWEADRTCNAKIKMKSSCVQKQLVPVKPWLLLLSAFLGSKEKSDVIDQSAKWAELVYTHPESASFLSASRSYPNVPGSCLIKPAVRRVFCPAGCLWAF